MSETTRDDGRTAIVTGGTGVLGSAIVRAFLEDGARGSVPFRRPGELDSLRKTLSGADSERLSGVQVDLTDEAVNTAGGFAGGSPIHETPWSVWQHQLDGNLKTAVIASRAVVPAMRRRGRGTIVNVSSRPAEQSGKNLEPMRHRNARSSR